MLRTLTSPLGYCLVAISMLFFSGSAMAKDPAAACEASMDRTVGRYSECLLNADAHYARQGNTTKLEKRQARCEAHFERRATRAIARHGEDYCPSSDLVTAMAERTENFAGNIALEAAQTEALELLYVQSAYGGELTDDTLTLMGVNEKTAWFSNRPHRESGQESTEAFVSEWTAGGAGSFAAVPPNAEFSCEVDGKVQNQALELQNPQLVAETDLYYDISRIGDDVGGESLLCEGPAYLFIDAGSTSKAGGCAEKVPAGFDPSKLPTTGNADADEINQLFFSTDFSTLGSSGVSLHGWDETEFLPQTWIQEKESEGHSANTASGGVVNNQMRVANLKGVPQQGPNGMISIFLLDYSHLPELGGVIYNTQAKSGSTQDPLITVQCSYVTDGADDNRANDGCGCYDTQAVRTACHGVEGAPSSFDPATDTCGVGEWAACGNPNNPACTNCDNVCVPYTPGVTYGPQCAIKGPGILGLMPRTLERCSTFCAAGTSTGCYNEPLYDSRQWRTASDAGSPDFFPQAIWAFSYVKAYQTDRQPQSWENGCDPSQGTGCIWQGFTTRAWQNFNAMYPDANVPLLELDVLAAVTEPAFSVVCDGLDDTRQACTDALTLAAVDPTATDKVYCFSDTDMTGSAVPLDGGVKATCTCNGGKYLCGNSCQASPCS